MADGIGTISPGIGRFGARIDPFISTIALIAKLIDLPTQLHIASMPSYSHHARLEEWESTARPAVAVSTQSTPVSAESAQQSAPSQS